MYVMHRSRHIMSQGLGSGSKTIFTRKEITITIDHSRIATISLWCHAGANISMHNPAEGKKTVIHRHIAQRTRNMCASRPGESSSAPHPKNLNPTPLRGRTQIVKTPQTGSIDYLYIIRFGSYWLIRYVAGGLRQLVVARDVRFGCHWFEMRALSGLLFEHAFDGLRHGKLLRAGLEHLDELVLAIAFPCRAHS